MREDDHEAESGNVDPKFPELSKELILMAKHQSRNQTILSFRSRQAASSISGWTRKLRTPWLHAQWPRIALTTVDSP